MVTTTGAADAGALLVGGGGRAKMGSPSSEGADNFAETLDRQMRPTRAEAAAIKGRETAEKRSASAPDKAPASVADGEEVPDSDGSAAAGAADMQGQQASAEETSETEEPVAAGALGAAVQVTEAAAKLGGLALSQEGAVQGAEEAAALEGARQAAGEGGKILPQSEAAIAQAPLAGSGIVAESHASEQVRGGANPARSVALNTIVAHRPSATADPLQEPEGELGLETSLPSASPAELKDGNKAEATFKNSDLLLQAMRLGGGALIKSGTAENGSDIAAMQAFLREGPRTDPGTPTPTVAAALSAPSLDGTAPSTPQNLAVLTPLDEPGWDRAMGERVVWMTRQGVQEAQIQLNPRDLGPVEVRVSVHQDQASVMFTTHTAAAREALEAALPRLREMLAENGLNLAHSDVSHQSPQQGHGGSAEGGYRAHGMPGGNGALEEGVRVVAETAVSSRGAVDFYA